MEEDSCKYAYLGRLEGDRCELPWFAFASCGNSFEESYGKSLRCIWGSSQSFLLLAGYRVALQGRVLHRVDGEVCGVVILGVLCCMATVGSAVGRAG